MWPDQVSNPGPLTYESGALPTVLRGPACQRTMRATVCIIKYCVELGMTPGQTIQTHQNVSRVLIYKWHRRFSTGWSDSGTKKADRLK